MERTKIEVAIFHGICHLRNGTFTHLKALRYAC
jgi:hypothetical protein